MNKLFIRGGKRLTGEISVHGAKNSVLPLLSATILSAGESVLHNCPVLSDVEIACEILECLGCTVKREGATLIVNTSHLKQTQIPECLMTEMRSSIVFLGALLARTGRARVNFPGGCEIGQRPIDLHLQALRQMGVVIEEEHGFLNCTAPDSIKGTSISLSFPSVGATENIMLAACTAEGETVIHNAAGEPEIVDLANYLVSCGAKIRGAGENTIYIQGVSSLHSVEHTVIADRIVASSYLCAAAVTRGEVLLHNVQTTHLSGVLPLLEEAGCRIVSGKTSIYMNAPSRPKAIRLLRTMPYPGFPTDAQPILMAVTAIGDGTSVFIENIFENRFKHVGEFIKMGANIKLEGRVAIVEGVEELSGANLKATDLRGGAALIIAALSAKGESRISELQHIDRGYEKVELALGKLGADIQRIDE